MSFRYLLSSAIGGKPIASDVSYLICSMHRPLKKKPCIWSEPNPARILEAKWIRTRGRQILTEKTRSKRAGPTMSCDSGEGRCHQVLYFYSKRWPTLGPAKHFSSSASGIRLLKVVFLYRSEGFPRTGYFIPGRVGIGAWAARENSVSSSCRATGGAFLQNGCISTKYMFIKQICFKCVTNK